MKIHAGHKRVRRLAWLILFFILLTGALRIALIPGVSLVVNRVLAANLAPRATVERIGLGILRGSVKVEGLSIDQPDGFGEGKFLELGNARVRVRWRSIFRDTIEIARIGVDDLHVVIVKGTNGLLNVAMLAPLGKSVPEPDERDSGKASSASAIKLEILAAQRLSLIYRDLESSAARPLVIHLRNAEIRLQDAVFEPRTSRAEVLTGSLQFSGQLDHEDAPPCYIGLAARFGTLSTNIPALVAGLVISGLELDSAGSAIPAGVATTVGGNVADATATIRINPGMLDVKASIETAGAQFPLVIRGTPDKPRVESGALLLGAFGRVGGVVGNTLGNLADSGVRVGEGALNVVDTVGRGAVDMVSGVGKGVFGTVKSAVTLDVKGVGRGLGDSVSAVTKGTAGTLKDVGGSAFETVGDVRRITTGKTSAAQWRENKKNRYDKAWEDAKGWVNNAAYPSQP